MLADVEHPNDKHCGGEVAPGFFLWRLFVCGPYVYAYVNNIELALIP